MTARQHSRRLLLIWLVLTLSACSPLSSSIAPTSPGTEQVLPSPPADRAKTILVLWHAWPAPEDRALAALVERYNRRTPQVQVVLQSRPVASLTSDLALAVAEGGGPHMAIVPNHSLGALADTGSILAIDGMLPAAELARLLPTTVRSAEVRSAAGSTLYGVPLTFDTLALYYNRANFASAPPADATALLDVARGLTNTSGDPPTWGLAMNLSLDRTIGYLYAFGGQIFDEQSNLVLGLDGRLGAEAWLRWLVELHDDRAILASTDGILVDNALQAGEALMTIDWSHAIGTYRSLWADNLGVALLPRIADSEFLPQPYVQSDLLALNARIGAESERQAAVEFMRYMIGADAQSELLRAGRQPSLLSLDIDAVADVAPMLREAALVFRAQAEQGQPMPNSRAANEVVWGVMSDMHGNALRRLLSPEQAVAGADAALRDRLGLPPAP